MFPRKTPRLELRRCNSSLTSLTSFPRFSFLWLKQHPSPVRSNAHVCSQHIVEHGWLKFHVAQCGRQRTFWPINLRRVLKPPSPNTCSTSCLTGSNTAYLGLANDVTPNCCLRELEVSSVCGPTTRRPLERICYQHAYHVASTANGQFRKHTRLVKGSEPVGSILAQTLHAKCQP